MRVPVSYWINKENRIEALYWIMDKTGRNNISNNDFYSYGLMNLLNHYDTPRVFNALNEVLNIPEPKVFMEMVFDKQRQSNLIQKDFATKIGIKPSSFYVWKIGKQLPSFLTIIMICDKLGINLRKY